MSKRTKRGRAQQQSGKPSGLRGIALGSVALAIILFVVWWVVKPSPDNRPVPEQAVTNVAAPVSADNPVFGRLLGKWVRPDGGYVLEIKSADAAGKLDAGYFNPNPIHVARAQAMQAGSVVTLYVELQDVNYPGSNYTLTYDAADDVFKGIYFQAIERQKFEVFFQRVK